MIFLLLLNCVFAQVSDPAPSGDHEKILSSLRDAMTRREAILSRFQAEGIETQSYTKAGEKQPIKETITFFKYCKNGKAEKLSEIRLADSLQPVPPSNEAEAVYVSTSEQFFTARRNSKSSPYLLGYLGNSQDVDPRMDKFKTIVRIPRTRYFQPGVTIGGVSLIKLLNEPNFEIKKVSQQELDGKELTRIDFANVSKEEPQKRKEGWILVDPDLDWLPRAFDFSVGTKNPMKYTGTINYQDGGGGIPFPESTTFEIQTNITQKRHFVYKDFSTNETPVEEFQLATYGLGDMNVPGSTKEYSISTWLIVAAILAIILSLILARLGREKGSAPSNSTPRLNQT